MAGDWIKAEHTLPDKPEVVAMAACLKIDQDAVVGKLLRLWIWADQQFSRETILKRNCNGLTVSLSFIDRVTFCDGFGKALIGVGWLDGSEGSYSLPNFERHNGTTAKERASTYRRVKTSREVKRNCNGASVTKPLPETETETELDIKGAPPSPPKGESAEVVPENRTRNKRRQMARSVGPANAAIAGIEIDGSLVMYDDDPMRWESAFVAWWNERDGVCKRNLNTLDTPSRSMLMDRLSEPDWHWKQTAAMFPLWTPSRDWVPTLSWFLEPATVSKILDGRYEQRKAAARQEQTIPDVFTFTEEELG